MYGILLALIIIRYERRKQDIEKVASHHGIINISQFTVGIELSYK
jgi:hypothetical protein